MSAETQPPEKKKTPLWIPIVIGLLIVGFIGSLFDSGEEDAVVEPETVAEEQAAEEPAVEQEPAEPEQEREPFPDIEYTGSGDSILQLELPAGPDSIGIASITHSGSSNFAIWALDENLEQDDLLVNEIGNYSGTVPFNLSTSVRITAFEISADGPWTVTLKDVLTLREIEQGSPATGEGPDALVYKGETTVAQIAHEGASNFSVWSYGQGSDLLVNEIGNYSGQVRWQSGPALIQISADGPWTIQLQ
jgi:hypothetical protein